MMKTFRYSVVAIGLVMVANVALLRAQEDDAAPSAVDELTLKQSQLADKYQKLEDLIFNMADFEARENPQRAALLKEAYRQSKDRLTLSALNSVVESLERNSLKKAVETQETVKGDLSALLELLMSENRSDRLKSKSQRLKEYIKELKRLQRMQASNRGRTEGGADMKDLSENQGRIEGRTRELGDDIAQNEGQSGEGKDGEGKDG
ncbi:MAG TPA: hypothetical protein DCY79_23460, partial [Planctomycetaceae bacterium]|nr:hypothetical protein [Planctomycetaceae bacterium]